MLCYLKLIRKRISCFCFLYSSNIISLSFGCIIRPIVNWYTGIPFTSFKSNKESLETSPDASFILYAVKKPPCPDACVAGYLFKGKLRFLTLSKYNKESQSE